MKIKVSTEIMKELVSRAVKGAGNNKLIPLTSLMLIKLENNILTLATTDSTNYLYVSSDKVEGEDFYIVVPVEQLSKLVSKMTCKEMSLEVTTNFLQVVGNGTYQIDIPLDEGEFIKYPDPMEGLELDEDNRRELNLSNIHTILESCKSSLAATLEVPCYTGYYMGDSVVTTNNYTMSAYDVNVFGQDLLVPPEFINLLDVMTSEKISSYIMDDVIVCTSPDCVVYGRTMEGIEDYPIDGIKAYISQEMESNCKVKKCDMLSVLDRLMLFVGAYDDGAIRFTFTKDGLDLQSMQSNGIETVPYTESENFKPFTGMVDITELLNTVKSYPEEVVKIYFGFEKAIKFVSGNLTFVIALLQEDENGTE